MTPQEVQKSLDAIKNIKDIRRKNRVKKEQENHESFSEANDRELKEEFLKYNRQ